jgi:hypothetical protein
MGGAAYTFHGVGVNYVALRGQAPEPSVLLLNHKAGEIHVRIEPVNAEALWNGYADPEGEPLIGFFALQQALYRGAVLRFGRWILANLIDDVRGKISAEAGKLVLWHAQSIAQN